MLLRRSIPLVFLFLFCHPTFPPFSLPVFLSSSASSSTSFTAANAKEYYVASMNPSSTSYYKSQQFVDLMTLAVEMVNNKTDGWWDYETRDVILNMRANDTMGMNGDADINAILQDQMKWAQSHGENLVGYIGGPDSMSSIQIAAVGNVYILPQISYAATASDLTNFAYFTRTCNTNDDTSPALATFIGNTLKIHDVAMIYSINDAYTVSAAETFTTSFAALGPDYRVLMTYPYDPHYPELIPDILDLVVQKGTPGVLIVCQQADSEQFFHAVQEGLHDVEKYMFFHPEPGDLFDKPLGLTGEP